MPIINTPLGRVRGAVHDGGLVFRGIRFAEPPTGERRFCPPEPASPWSGVYDATEFGASAPQEDVSGPPVDEQTPVGPTDEDCLFLNVYTPAADGSKRPVLFWIHGGGYLMGAGRVYDGSVFTKEHDVVVVTINYRLGALGFLHLGHLDPGLRSSVNNGILDQICALEWTRDNIAAFGGDPDNVMIFGQSAGGTCTAMLLGAPAAEGLFHRAAVHSPQVDLIEVGDGHVDFTNRCIRRLGGDPATNGLETLRNARCDQFHPLVFPDPDDPDSIRKPGLWVRREDNVNFSPAIDGHLIPRPVADTVRLRGKGNVPFLGGGCRHEGTLFPESYPSELVKADGSECTEADAIAMFEEVGADPATAMAAYESFAPGSSAHRKLVYALTDVMFRNSMVRILDAAADSGATCWSWMCTWEAVFGDLRATHGMELLFLWDWVRDKPEMKRYAGPGAPEDLGRVMRELWVNFARTGVPSADGEPEWAPHDTKDRPVLLLDAERRMERRFDDEVREVWF